MKNINFSLKKETNQHNKSQFRFNDEICFTADGIKYTGDLVIPLDARAIVIFSHGFGSSRHSSRNIKTAKYLNKANMATLLVSLESIDESLMNHGHPIQYLVDHLLGVTRWVRKSNITRHLTVGYFGSSTGAAVALAAAAREKGMVEAIVCRGGRPDLAIEELNKVQIPVLMIAGTEDKDGIALSELALDHLKGHAEMELVKGASHLFEEKGKLKEVAILAVKWFYRYLVSGEERAKALMIDSMSGSD